MKIGFFDGVIIFLITVVFLLVLTFVLSMFDTKPKVKIIIVAVPLLSVIAFVVVNLNTSLLDSIVDWLVNTYVWRWIKEQLIAIVVFAILFGLGSSVQVKKP